MNLDNTQLYKIAILLLFILIAMQLIDYYYSYEHMDASLLNHQYVDWPKPYSRNNIPAPQYQTPRFYFENDDVPRKGPVVLMDPLPLPEGIPCGPQFDWATPLAAGANDKTDDNLWNITNPKMILRNDCISCNKHNAGNGYDDGPTGLPSMDGEGLLEFN